MALQPRRKCVSWLLQARKEISRTRTDWNADLHPHWACSPEITKAPRVGASFSTSRSEPGIMGEGLGGGGGPIWTAFAAALRGTDDFQALALGLFSGKIPGVHSGSVLVGFGGISGGS